MKVTARIEESEKPKRTLANLENGVVARVRLNNSDGSCVRLRVGESVLSFEGGQIHVQTLAPKDYEVVEVIGKLIIELED